MNFLKFFTIGNRTLARIITKEIVELYIRIKRENPEISKEEILKKTLSQSNLQAAKELLSSGFLNEKSMSLGEAIYNLVVDSSPVNKKKIFIPSSNCEAYVEEIKNVLNEYGLSEKD